MTNLTDRGVRSGWRVLWRRQQVVVAALLALLLGSASGSQAQAVTGPASPDVGVGGTNSIIPSIFTNTSPPVTVIIKPDSLDSDYRRAIHLVSFNSIDGYDDRPENSTLYTVACEPYWFELFQAKIDAGSSSTSFEMEGFGRPAVDDGLCGVRVYEQRPTGEGAEVFFLFHALSGDDP